MSYQLVLLCSFSILIPAIAALIRIKNTSNTFLPFFILLWIGTINEVLSMIAAYARSNTTASTNFYILFEAMLLLWQFYNWSLTKRKTFYFAIAGVFLVLWLGEYYLLPANAFLYWFWVSYAFTILMLAQHRMTFFILNKKDLYSNAAFWIIGCMILYFFLTILIQSIWHFGLHLNAGFRNNIFYIMVGTNVFINLLYAIAILWIPRKPKYITA